MAGGAAGGRWIGRGAGRASKRVRPHAGVRQRATGYCRKRQCTPLPSCAGRGGPSGERGHAPGGWGLGRSAGRRRAWLDAPSAARVREGVGAKRARGGVGRRTRSGGARATAAACRSQRGGRALACCTVNLHRGHQHRTAGNAPAHACMPPPQTLAHSRHHHHALWQAHHAPHRQAPRHVQVGPGVGVPKHVHHVLLRSDEGGAEFSS